MRIQDFPKDKHYNYFKAAYELAISSPGIGGRHNNTFRLATTLVFKKNILAVRYNSAKTHPKLVPFSAFPFLHSESNAILSVGMDNCEDSVMYVLRVLRNRDIALAKPCHSCMKLIEYVGIKKIFYTTKEGYEEC